MEEGLLGLLPFLPNKAAAGRKCAEFVAKIRRAKNKAIVTLLGRRGPGAIY